MNCQSISVIIQSNEKYVSQTDAQTREGLGLQTFAFRQWLGVRAIESLTLSVLYYIVVTKCFSSDVSL